MKNTETMQLNLHESDLLSNPTLVLESEAIESPKIIYGRMLSGKTVNKIGLKNLFESLWQNKAGVKIEDYTEGIFILTIESEAIKNRILKGQPWHFAGSYLILVEADAMTQVSIELFKQIPFWIQVYGLPPGLLVKPYGEKLGQEIANSIGDFLEFDPNYRRNFMRFRVLLDSSKPLSRGKLIRLDKSKGDIWISFRYERLSKFCFYCGHLDHIQKDCAMLIEELENGQKPTLQYNDSLKTTGLAHVTALDANLVETSGKNSMVQMVSNAIQTRSRMSLRESNEKRQKVANIIADEGERVNTNSHERKEAEGKTNNTSANSSKSISKGGKTNSPTQKITNRDHTPPTK